MRIGIILIVFVAFCMSCGPKPAYKTSAGKKKQKYYNNLQFGGDPSAVPAPKTKKKKN
jgi:hypothetical protein